jgi:hypothetical protein
LMGCTQEKDVPLGTGGGSAMRMCSSEAAV